MAETFYPQASEEVYAAVIRREIDRHAPPLPETDVNLDDLETLLRAAEERAKPRTELPPQLNRFPLSWGPVRHIILKFYKRLFHDQRAVNTVLIHALRETLAVNRRLLQRMAEPSSSAPGGQEGA